MDALVTNRVWTALGLDPATTLHDVRWGAPYGDDYVWVFEISGAVPPAHLVGGYAGAVSERQPPVYFGLGGGTIKGISRPGEIVWSRVFLMDGALHVDIGRGTVVELPAAETERRWQATTPQWPIMHAVLHGVTRDQMMARHRPTTSRSPTATTPRRRTRRWPTKAAMFDAMGVRVHLCGDVTTWESAMKRGSMAQFDKLGDLCSELRAVPPGIAASPTTSMRSGRRRSPLLVRAPIGSTRGSPFVDVGLATGRRRRCDLPRIRMVSRSEAGCSSRGTSARAVCPLVVRFVGYGGGRRAARTTGRSVADAPAT